jgi:DDE superfamily endonuclease
MNLQIVATLDGALVAVGAIPIPGARHDAYAYAASGLADILPDHPTVADLGCVGVDGIDTIPYKRFPGTDLNAGQVAFNTALSKTRAAVEHAIAHLKTCACSAKKASLPSTAGKVPEHAQGRYRPILLRSL